MNAKQDKSRSTAQPDPSRPRLHAALALTLALAGCALQPPLICRGGEQPAVAESLYFGTATRVGVVEPGQWQEFVNQVVIPRFPQGLTSWEASGQWRSADGVVEREASHVLHLVHPETEGNELAVQEIMSKYKAQFQQEAVLRVRSNACASF